MSVPLIRAFICSALFFGTSVTRLCASFTDGHDIAALRFEMQDTTATSMRLSDDKKTLAYVVAKSNEVVLVDFPSGRLVRRFELTTKDSDLDSSELPTIRGLTHLNPHSVFVLSLYPAKDGSFHVQLLVKFLKILRERNTPEQTHLGWASRVRVLSIDRSGVRPTPMASLSPIDAYVATTGSFTDCGLYLVKTYAIASGNIDYKLIDGRSDSPVGNRTVKFSGQPRGGDSLEWGSPFSSIIDHRYCMLWDRWNYVPQAGSFVGDELVAHDISGSEIVTSLKEKLAGFRSFSDMAVASSYDKYGNPALIEMALSNGQVLLAGKQKKDSIESILLERYSIDKRKIVASKVVPLEGKIASAAIVHSGAYELVLMVKYSATNWRAITIRI